MKRKAQESESNIQTALSTNINQQIQVAVDQLNSVVEQMNLTSIALNESSASSKENTNRLLMHSEKTASNSFQAAEKMKNIESSALHISAFSQEILSNSQTSIEELQYSFESFQFLQKRFVELSESHYTLLEQMNQLVNHSKRIHTIVHSIGAISQKTKILALNASIEAARAGEHGKGFSVVANEVGNLANQTSLAVEETRETINIIQSEIKTSTEMVQTETTQVEAGSIEMNKIMSSLESFKERLNHITKMVQVSSESVDEQSSNVQEISNLLQEISQLATDNKEYVERVNFDLNKQHINVEEMRIIGTSLTTTSKELQSLVKQNDEHVLIDQLSIYNIKTNLSKHLNSNQLISMEQTSHEKILNFILSENEQLEAIWTNRLDGTFVYSNPPAGLINAKMRPWFLQASQGSEYISEPYISAVTKKLCITLSFPIYEGNLIICVLGTDISIN
nr:methyl-accepting chemotaxis protein [Lysinibacillus timonensis]